MKMKLKSLINKLNIFEKDSKPAIKGWTSGNLDIDKFIKDTMYDAKHSDNYYSHFLEWVPYDRFTNIKQIGVGGFSKVYSATWLDGKSSYYKLNSGSWKKSIPKPMKVTLKRLNGSQNMSPEYLNELKVCWNLYIKLKESLLPFYGITKDPETKEFMIIEKYAGQGNLRNILSNNFNKILWKDKIELLCYLALNLKNLHELEYYHKNIHSGNILFYDHYYKKSYILDFGLTGPVKEQKDNVIYGVLPYIAPEVLNGKPYTSSSDIYSFGVIMAELSSGKPPFHDRKHNANLSLEICNGLRPEFGKETPEIYKKLAYRCMNANSNQRPIATQLYEILEIWKDSINCKNFGYKRKEIKAIFEEADKGIPDISTSYKKDPDAVYTSRTFKFSNLPKPVNLSVIASYLNDEENYQNCHIS